MCTIENPVRVDLSINSRWDLQEHEIQKVSCLWMKQLTSKYDEARNIYSELQILKHENIKHPISVTGLQRGLARVLHKYGHISRFL